jgi:hypothetical protein
MGFFAMNPFVCLAKGTNIGLDTFYKAVGGSPLVMTGVATDRARLTHLGQCTVQS